MKQKRVFLTCGPSGCGKSSWIRERINKYGGYHVSRDMVRFNLLGEGEDYSNLKRTICINILNFKYLKTENFHTGYRLKEIHTHQELTDVIEMHFIEIPKLPAEADVTDMLVAWTEFLKDPESEKVRSLELSL